MDIDKILNDVRKRSRKIKCPDYLAKRVMRMIDGLPEKPTIQGYSKVYCKGCNLKGLLARRYCYFTAGYCMCERGNKKSRISQSGKEGV